MFPEKDKVRTAVYECPDCKETYTLKGSREGVVHRCRKCSGVLRKKDDRGEIFKDVFGTASDEEIAGVSTRVEPRKIKHVCPGCGARYDIHNPEPEETYPCGKCGTDMQPVPKGQEPEKGRNFGKYVVEKELGRGGMGVVYKAWDPEGQRAVAIKCMLRSDDETETRRFEREARTASSLKHPNIVEVYEVGVEGETPYIAMEYVEGETLSDVLSPHRKKGERIKLDRAVEMIRDAALALGHAHGRRIVHRDVKPHNIMVDRDGKVRVMDFGLARELKRGVTVTSTGEVLGTPQYMSPEQAKGEREKFGPQTDVWALGVMLYEVAGRCQPFEGETAAEILHRITHEEAVPLRKRNPRIERDLETVVMKCLEGEVGERYPTAGKVAEELSRYLDRVPVVAKPPGLVKRAGRKIRKRKAVWLSVASGAAAVIILAAILIPQLGSARMEAEEARSGRQRAELALQLWAGISNHITQAEINARAGEIQRSRAKLDEGIRECRNFLAKTDSPAAHYFLGRLLRARGDREEALKELDRALEMDPDLGEARFERGILRVQEYLALKTVAFQTALALRGELAAPPAAAELEEANPELTGIKDKAREDLSAKVGRSSYFREVDGIFGKAQLARVTGDRKEASRLFKRVLQMEPSYVSALVSLTDIATERAEFAEAVDLATRAITLHRGLGPAYLSRSDAHLQRARANPVEPATPRWLEAALKDAQDALAMGEDTSFAHYTLGNAQRLMGDIERALESYTKALETDPRSANILSNRGAMHAELGNHQAAAADFRKALESNPNLPEARTNLGISLMDAGDLQGALKEHDFALKLNPNLAYVYVNRSHVLIRKGEFDRAKEDLEKALELQPGTSQAHYNLGVIYTRLKKFDDALREYDEAIRLKGNRADYYANRGHAKSSLGDLDGAIRDATEAIKLQPAYPVAFINRGDARRRKGDFAGALADFEEAIRLQPRNWLALYGRAKTKSGRGDIDGAIADYSESLKINPKQPKAHWNRARNRFRKGDVKGALADYTEAVRIDPNHAPSYVDRGVILSRLGRLDEALADYDQAIRIQPGLAVMYRNRGNVRARKGDKEGAIKDYTEAIRLDPRHPGVYYNRAYLRIQKGDKKGGIEDIRKVLEVAPHDWPQRRAAEDDLRRLSEEP